MGRANLRRRWTRLGPAADCDNMAMVRTSNALALLKVLIAAAWADSELSPAELNYIKELARHFDLDDDAWFQLQPYIEDPVPRDEQEAVVRDLLARLDTPSERKAVINHLEQIIEADDRISDEERDLLKRYAEILMEASSMDLLLGGVKGLFQSSKRHSKVDIDEFLRNKILFKLRKRAGDTHISPDMHRLAVLGGLMGIVAHADHDIHARELDEIRRQLSARGRFDEDAMDLLLTIIEEESVRGLDRHRLIAEYAAEADRDGRVELLDLLFGVATADGAMKHLELEELRAISSAFHLSHKQYIAAKLRAKD